LNFEWARRCACLAVRPSAAAPAAPINPRAQEPKAEHEIAAHLAHLLLKAGRQRSRQKPPKPIHYVVSKLVDAGTDSRRTIRWLIALMVARHRIDRGGLGAATPV
jgi:hypothetical protein